MLDALNVEPLIVHCFKCDYEQQIGWLPMPVDSVALLMKHARCPNRHGARSLGMGPKPKATSEGDPIAWLSNGDTGISSRTIWSVMRGLAAKSTDWPDVPYDPSDFGRCYRLLKVMPSWRARLPEVVAKFPKWKPLVDAWDELTALYEEELQNASGMAPKLYARMKELRGEP